MNLLGVRLGIRESTAICLLVITRLPAASIDGYTTIVVPPPSYGSPEIHQIIIRTLQQSGIIVIERGPTGSDATKICSLNWSQHGALTQYCEFTVKDYMSGKEVARSAESSRMRFGVPANVVGSIEDAWKALHFHGFNEAAYQANLKELFPDRPRYPLTEEVLRKMPLSGPIEGIWADPENHYLMGVVADSRHQVDYVGIVLFSDIPTWHPGEIKLELREAASEVSYVGSLYVANKQPRGVIGRFDAAAGTLNLDETLPDGSRKSLLYVKTFPKNPGTSIASGTSQEGGWTGSGFLISGNGLVATNYHVAGQAHALMVKFPEAGKQYVGHIVLKDPNNDLAIIQLEGFSLKDLGQTQISYGFDRSKHVSLGDSVYAIGYPMSDVMGQNPKYSNGTVNSKSGIGDDMVHLQISVPVQPGNSGSPLLDANGNVVGIVVATLTQTQNVNYAIKSDYLFNLCEMLPDSLSLEAKGSTPKPDDVAPFVCLITAR